MKEYEPPYTISDEILNLVGEISELVGKLHLTERYDQKPYLRKENRIKTIYSSLKIENNSLAFSDVTALIDGKRVVGPSRDIKEVENAIKTYEKVVDFDPFSLDSLLSAHSIMMRGIIKDAGKIRTGNVGVFNGTDLIHLAPPPSIVYEEMRSLFDWVKASSLNMLVKSSIFHYEFEFIHPFSDGNGRMGRLWQTLLLNTYNHLFLYLPVENIIRERQQEYYTSLKEADEKNNSSCFVGFILKVIYDTLKEEEKKESFTENVKKLLSIMSYKEESAKEIADKLKIKRIQTVRDRYINPAIKMGVVGMTNPNSPKSREQKYFKK